MVVIDLENVKSLREENWAPALSQISQPYEVNQQHSDVE